MLRKYCALIRNCDLGDLGKRKEKITERKEGLAEKALKRRTGWSLPRHAFDTLMTLYQIVTALLLVVPAYYFYTTLTRSKTPLSTEQSEKKAEEEPKTIMQPPRDDLEPPKDDPFTLEQLREFDGSDPSKPIYVSIKGTVFDVSRKRETYGPGGSYNIFAGKDGSKGLGLSSLKAEDAIPDYSTLPDTEKTVLNDWHSFFTKRYNIVGRVIDLPPAVANLSSNL
ncbi:hypothetical protein NM688_g8912 [Phlebia brevispora]|uniref:Uncharacterized protein n=1 Tax=Phlebia brevispora TaxID=194682 RepID=A0ACC1RQ58_9APHY|nr:hypothetical protein NM688_g8912 [Phlebia brevispora]